MKKETAYKAASLIVCLVFVLQVFGCGTILYPERRGQVTGRLDVGVVVLDGVGLLLFFIPGVIAFAVDFVTGAIYLPPGSTGIEKPGKIRSVIMTDPSELSIGSIETQIYRATGLMLDLQAPDVAIYELRYAEAPDVLNVLRALEITRTPEMSGYALAGQE